MYWLERTWGLGVPSLIWGLFLNYLVQVVGQLGYLYSHNGFEYYKFPGVANFFDNSREVLSFSFNCNLSNLSEYISDEIISIILMFSADPSLNIRVWSIIVQNIELIFLIAEGLSAYMRPLAISCLSQHSIGGFGKIIRQFVVYIFITFFMFNLLIFVFADRISELLFNDAESVALLASCLRLFLALFVAECYITFLKNVLRMLEYDDFVLLVDVAVFVVCFPATYAFITLKYRIGVFQTCMVLAFFNLVATLLYVCKLKFQFEEKVKQKIKSLDEEKENEKKLENLLEDVELTETKRSSE